MSESKKKEFKSNSTLRRQRIDRGWSQQRVAAQLNTTEDMVSKWERGVSKPGPFYQEKLSSLYGLPVRELGLIDVLDDHIQRVIATQITTMDQTIHERLDQVESILNLAWEAWFTANPKQAARETTRLLPGLERIIYTPHLSAYMLRATELAIRGHGLLGSVFLDSLQNDMALFHYTQAHKYAEEIHEKDLAITYLALIGDVLRRQNKKQDALRYMEDARDRATSATSATQGHILQLLAYTYADTGNEPAFSERYNRQQTSYHLQERGEMQQKRSSILLKYMKFKEKPTVILADLSKQYLF